jgi:pyrimidine operon attenuation protein/uracil phosphoribosyltransferase
MKKIMEESEIRRALIRIAHEIIEKNKGIKNLALIGIKRRGDFVARRIAKRLEKDEKHKIPIGALDITLYRDDLQLVAEAPIIEDTDIAFNINQKTIILVDDVLYTGRTIRAAIEEILDFGRPKAIQLAVLIDRGHRELPIQADFIGKKVPAAKSEIIDVHIKELDGEDSVIIHHYQKKKKRSKKKKAKNRIKLQTDTTPKIKQLTITDVKKSKS